MSNIKSSVPPPRVDIWRNQLYKIVVIFAFFGVICIQQDKVNTADSEFIFFDNSFDQSKSMVRLARAERMVLSGLVFARKIARMILIQII